VDLREHSRFPPKPDPRPNGFLSSTPENIMGTNSQGSLDCPECDRKVVWDGNQFVCTKCPWKEHLAMPPSPSSPTREDDPKKTRRK